MHGEPNGQEVLKEKIIDTTNIPVSIPEYGETYELGEEVILTNRATQYDGLGQIRNEAMTRLKVIERAVAEMINIAETDLLNEKISDREIFTIRERIKEMEKYMLRIIE